MIPKYQRILFWTLNAAILVLVLVLLRGCEQTREKLTRHRDETPLAAPVATPSETVHLALANDATGAIAMADRQVALPVEPTARVQALLARLIAEYSYKGSAHPIESGPAVDEVFLLDLPLAAATRGISGLNAVEEDEAQAAPHAPGGQLAVVDLHGTFADHHPSGIEAEQLTVASIVGTLYANFPRIEEVRFLVDGQPRETLNGHVDLMRSYRVVDTAAQSGAGAR